MNNEINEEKWVMNLSKKKLTDSELSVLKKGPKFAIAPEKLPKIEIINNIECSLKYLKNSAAVNVARAKVVNILKNAKIPERNLTKAENLALKI